MILRASFSKIFYVVFSVVFALLTANLLFNKYNLFHPYFMTYQTSKVLPWLLLEVCVVTIAFLLIRKFSVFFTKRYFLILIAFCVVMFIIQVCMINVLRYEPKWDLSEVYNGAIEWTTTGTFASRLDYFYQYPNNLGILVFFRLIFGLASFVGIADFFAVASIANSFMCCIMFALVSLCCRKICKSPNAGIMALVLIALTLPFYFSAVAFYTDMSSIMFPVLSFWLYLCAKDAPNMRKRFLLFSALGLALAVGALIKFTVLIVFIAIIIDSVMNYKKTGNNSFSGLLCALAVIVAVFCLFNLYIYSTHLDKSIARNTNMPILHWVHMGLSGNFGLVNYEDQELSRNLASSPEKNAVLWEGIVSRLKSVDIKFFMNKAKFAFGDGGFGLFMFRQNWPSLPSEKYISFTVAHLILIYVLAIVYAAHRAIKSRITFSPIPHLSIFGLLLFLISWEAINRHVCGFFSLFLIAAVMGVEMWGHNFQA